MPTTKKTTESKSNSNGLSFHPMHILRHQNQIEIIGSIRTISNQFLIRNILPFSVKNKKQEIINALFLRYHNQTEQKSNLGLRLSQLKIDNSFALEETSWDFTQPNVICYCLNEFSNERSKEKLDQFKKNIKKQESKEVIQSMFQKQIQQTDDQISFQSRTTEIMALKIIPLY